MALLDLERKLTKNYASLVFINGNFCAQDSDLALLPQGVVCKTGAEDFCDAENLHLRQQGIYLSLPKNVVIKPIIHCLFLTTEESALNNYNHKIILGENSEATIFVECKSVNVAAYLTNEVINIELQKNAKLQFYKLQNEATAATHTSQVTITQLTNSHLKTCFAAYGANYARENITVNLQEAHAACELQGFYHVKTIQQSENYVRVNHNASHTHSEMNYKGIADNKGRALFNGKIYVKADCQKVQAVEANHNLLLSKEAEVSSKPEFEIYADDVKCKHGATVGQIDEDALFYLRARGVDKDTAVELLTAAFAKSIFESIACNEIKERMMAVIPARMLA